MATPAGRAGLGGAAVAPSASQPDLQHAYGICAQEATAWDEEYALHTVHTDDWQATQGAWKALCPTITVRGGFLQAVRKSRARALQALGILVAQVQEPVWEAAPAPRPRAFAPRVRRLRAWAATACPDSAMQRQTLERCDTRAQCRRSDDHCSAPRPSTMVDRWRKLLARACVNTPYCPRTWAAAESRGRALAVRWHFCPSSPGTGRKSHGQGCPAARLNGKP